MLLKVRTKNHTAVPLRGKIATGNKRVVFRLGSLTPTNEIFPDAVRLGKPVIEINTAAACHNSGDKVLMKQLFSAAEVKSTEWAILNAPAIEAGWVDFPAIIKHKNSCKGKGIYLINNAEELRGFLATQNGANHIIEKYYNYSKEYRLHVTKDGCFYTCRKMLKQDAEERWHRHDMNSVWIIEENELFEKPSNWDSIVDECVKSLNAVGLTIGACDIKVQTEKGKKPGFAPDFIILEINSGPSMGDVTLIKYEQKLKEIVESV